MIVNLNVSGDVLSGKVYGPGGNPFSSPETLEIQIVTRNLNTDLTSVLRSKDTEFSCAFTELTIKIRVHGLDDIISKLNHI